MVRGGRSVEDGPAAEAEKEEEAAAAVDRPLVSGGGLEVHRGVR